ALSRAALPLRLSRGQQAPAPVDHSARGVEGGDRAEVRPARVRPLLAALVLCGATAAAHGETVLGGEHWRLGTSRGTVHVWRPEGYDWRSAGVVVYIHGYYTSADSSWNDDRLANQFHESRRNALFIVPEAPSSGEDPVVWPSLDSLLITVQRETRTRPLGPL